MPLTFASGNGSLPAAGGGSRSWRTRRAFRCLIIRCPRFASGCGGNPDDRYFRLVELHSLARCSLSWRICSLSLSVRSFLGPDDSAPVQPITVSSASNLNHLITDETFLTESIATS